MERDIFIAMTGFLFGVLSVFFGPFDFLPVLPLFSAPMTPHSYLDNLLYQLEDVRKLLIQVEENSPEWTKFDRLEDKLLAELANHSLED